MKKQIVLEYLEQKTKERDEILEENRRLDDYIQELKDDHEAFVAEQEQVRNEVYTRPYQQNGVDQNGVQLRDEHANQEDEAAQHEEHVRLLDSRI